MPTSEQDLEALHDGNEELRTQIAEARAAREQVTNQAETAARAAALKEEQARLEAELEAELNAVSDSIDTVNELEAKAAEPVETPYKRMMREAEEANERAQAEADERARRDALTPEQRKAEDDAAAKATADADAKAAREAAKANKPPEVPATGTGDNGNGGQ